jgi:DNA-binding NarL/FixJ family response regulator
MERLTPAQRETLALVAEGLRNKEIARRRGTSVRTVESHVYSAYQELGLTGEPGPRLRAAVAVRRAARAVMDDYCRGDTQEAIARRRGVSLRTVATTVSRAYDKVGYRSRREACAALANAGDD